MTIYSNNTVEKMWESSVQYRSLVKEEAGHVLDLIQPFVSAATGPRAWTLPTFVVFVLRQKLSPHTPDGIIKPFIRRL